jgi:hypothetical protein
MVEIDRGVPLTREAPITRAEEPVSTEVEAGSTAEAIGGAGALVLAILGLLGILPITLDAIAAIALGAALLLGGAAVARRYSRVVPSGTGSRARQEIVGALGFQSLAGIGGIVLGILALLGVRPVVLLAITAIVFGAALIVGGSGMARLARSAAWFRSDFGRVGGTEGAYAASGWEALVGIGVVVLGILALLGHAPLTLTLVAMLSAGAAVLVGGSMLAARMFGVFG